MVHSLFLGFKLHFVYLNHIKRKTTLMNDQELLKCLNSGHKQDMERAFYHLDKTMRKDFIYWSYLKYWYKAIDHSTIKEIYQESLIAFYNRINSRGTNEINVKIQAYFYGIARNKWQEYFRKIKYTEELKDLFVFIDGSEEEAEKEELLKTMRIYLEELPVVCQTVLKLTFHEDMDCREISAITPNLSIENCRQRRFKCLNKMREKMAATQKTKQQ